MSNNPNSLELMQACYELAAWSRTGLSGPAELVRSVLHSMMQETPTVAEEHDKADRMFKRLRKVSSLDAGLVIAAAKGLQIAPMETPETAKEGAPA